MHSSPGWPTLTAVLALGWVALPAPARAQASIEVDHAQGTVTLVDGHSRKLLRDGMRVRVRHPASIPVRILHSNSALYTCTLKQDVVRAPETDTLRTFMASLAPYLLEASVLVPLRLPRAAAPGKFGYAEAAAPAEAAVANALAGVLSAERGAGGLQQTQLLALDEVQTMRRRFGSDSLDLRDFREHLMCEESQGARCVRLKFVTDLVGSLRALQQSTAQLGPSDEPPAPQSLVGTSQKTLDDAEKVIGQAYAVEAVALRLANAATAFDCDTARLRWTAGGTVHLRLAPVSDPMLARGATARPLTLDATLVPDWIVRPGLGLSFMYAPRAARFPAYAAQKLSDGVHIARTGTQDYRFGYGLTLGLTWRWLDGRDQNVPEWRRLALWLPEFTVNPAKDMRSLALGGGISVGILRVGTGYAWFRHTVLQNGQTAGMIIPDASALATGPTYNGGASPYVSLSLMGLPGFLR